MRIVCDNCGAKYSIADEKVAGKMLRIRCKACSHAINVDGRDLAADEDDAPTAFGAVGDSVEWHAVIDGDQQGPFTEEQVREMVANGSLNSDSYVWRDGFDGWKVLSEVTELAANTAVTDSQEMAAQPEATPATGSALGGAAAAVAASAAASPAASSSGLGGVAAQPAAQAAVGGAAPSTGKRSENSVLFSLANLQALANKPGEGAAAPAPSVGSGAAHGDASGLIDIRALAASTGTVGGGGATDERAKVDELMSIGTGNPLVSPLGAAVLPAAREEEPEKNNKTLLIAIVAVGGLVFLGMAGLAAVMLFKESPAPATTAVAAAGEAPAPAAGAKAEAKPAAAAEPKVAAATAEAEPEANKPPPSAAAKSSGKSSRNSRRASARTAKSPEPKSTAKRAESASRSRRSDGGNDIDSLLNKAIDRRPAKSASAAAAEDLPEAPGREDVLKALRGVEGPVRSCGGGQHGVAMTSVSVSGKTGRVTGARVVSGPFAGTPAAACIARAVKKARFPRFKRTSFSVKFPFAL